MRRSSEDVCVCGRRLRLKLTTGHVEAIAQIQSAEEGKERERKP